jgi:type I restriction enzyme S subunit
MNELKARLHATEESLPTTWAWATLGEFLNARDAVIDPAKHPDQSFELYSVPSFETKSPEIVEGRAIGSAKQLVELGTVLICKINPRINRSWKVGPLGDLQQIASTEWICFPAHPAIEPDFLRYYMMREEFRSFLAANVSGVGGSLMRVRPATLTSYPFQIAPINEQRRIVERIDELFSDIEGGERALERTRKLLDRYRQAVLKAAVTGELTKDWREKHKGEIESGEALLTRILKARREAWEQAEFAKMRAKGQEPKGDAWKQEYREPSASDATSSAPLPDSWTWTSIGQLFAVSVGATPSRKEPAYWGGEIPWTSSGEVAFCRISKTRETISERGLNESSTRLLPVGTVLLAMIGEGKTRGQAAILDIAACNNQNAAAIRVADTPIPPEYLYYFLMWRYEETRRGSSGGNQPALNSGKVRSMAIPLPPLEEIEEICAQLETIFSVAESTSRDIETRSTEVAVLRQSILTAAFAGKLVPQDRSDEPASALLDRIRGNRTAAGKPPVKRRGRQLGKARKAIAEPVLPIS